ncbi:hypothetical protein EV380_0812 [Zhihengliuella halotolerans]|uniref:Uncharacterized protein n=1 Tax=Zhihengliuella halotolerans TaxID=370736 RepID=A0A4Q8ACM3_9MICC|nr:hypothetical protein EV380_0812 [Zhihengliuella halotolerans]
MAPVSAQLTAVPEFVEAVCAAGRPGLPRSVRVPPVTLVELYGSRISAEDPEVGGLEPCSEQFLFHIHQQSVPDPSPPVQRMYVEPRQFTEVGRAFIAPGAESGPANDACAGFRDEQPVRDG